MSWSVKFQAAHESSHPGSRKHLNLCKACKTGNIMPDWIVFAYLFCFALLWRKLQGKMIFTSFSEKISMIQMCCSKTTAQSVWKKAPIFKRFLAFTLRRDWHDLYIMTAHLAPWGQQGGSASCRWTICSEFVPQTKMLKQYWWRNQWSE